MIGGFLKYALGAALVALAVVGGLYLHERSVVADLRTENASLTRSNVALTQQAAQSAEARQVEAARAERWAGRAAELDASIEAIHNGEIPDENLDPRIADIVNGWLSNND